MTENETDQQGNGRQPVGKSQRSSGHNSKRGAQGERREPRPPPKPLTETRLRDLALHYAAKYATTAAKLESYLTRKIRERGMAEADDGSPQDIPAIVGGIVARLVELKYVDDEAYAKARTGSLLRRGYGKRRVAEDLRYAGVDEHTREDTAPSTPATREAAITLARKRRFGPYAADRAPDEGDGDEQPRLEPSKRQKQIAAMLRAGHGFDTARIIVDAPNVDTLETWLREAIDEALDDEEGFGL
ncbi:MAG: regulatory protein RecX [Marinomonas sp.]